MTYSYLSFSFILKWLCYKPFQFQSEPNLLDVTDSYHMMASASLHFQSICCELGYPSFITGHYPWIWTVKNVNLFCYVSFHLYFCLLMLLTLMIKLCEIFLTQPAVYQIVLFVLLIICNHLLLIAHLLLRLCILHWSMLLCICTAFIFIIYL